MTDGRKTIEDRVGHGAWAAVGMLLVALTLAAECALGFVALAMSTSEASRPASTHTGALLLIASTGLSALAIGTGLVSALLRKHRHPPSRASVDSVAALTAAAWLLALALFPVGAVIETLVGDVLTELDSAARIAAAVATYSLPFASAGLALRLRSFVVRADDSSQPRTAS